MIENLQKLSLCSLGNVYSRWSNLKKEVYSKLFTMFMPAIASYLQNLNKSQIYLEIYN
jgi:hypothetical protein